uniref:Uncharacterized protein n=1 Tax=Eutreptiella gymnastica TaxID=73025 RepID=A0A7S1IJ69_9EUGL
MVEQYPGHRRFKDQISFVLFLTDFYRVVVQTNGHASILLKQHLPEKIAAVLPVPTNTCDAFRGYLLPASILNTKLCLIISVAMDKIMQQTEEEIKEITLDYKKVITGEGRKQKGKGKKKGVSPMDQSLKHPDGTSDCAHKLIDHLLMPKVNLARAIGADSCFIGYPILEHTVGSIITALCTISVEAANCTPDFPGHPKEKEASSSVATAISRQLQLDTEKLKGALQSCGLRSTPAFHELPVWDMVISCVEHVSRIPIQSNQAVVHSSSLLQSKLSVNVT